VLVAILRSMRDHDKKSKTHDLSCDFLRLLTSCRPTFSTSDSRVAAGVEGTSLVFYRRASQYFFVFRHRIWHNGMRSGCEVATVDQRSMTEVPCVRLVESPMPPMLSHAHRRGLGLPSRNTTTPHAPSTAAETHAPMRRPPARDPGTQSMAKKRV
jgi:hypothetical protein